MVEDLVEICMSKEILSTKSLCCSFVSLPGLNGHEMFVFFFVSCWDRSWQSFEYLLNAVCVFTLAILINLIITCFIK